MQGNTLSKIGATVVNFFNKIITQLDETARFVKRESKLGAQSFAETLIVGCLSDSAISLARMCRLLKQQGVNITPQGLHERFNSEAVVLMQNLFLASLSQFKTEQSNVIDLLKPFSSVTLLDSSGISLPETLKNLYRGSGGAASAAGLKIQVFFDYVANQIKQMSVTEGIRSDQGFNGYLDWIEKGSLHLQDLGYFKLTSLAAIQQKGAYFISRLLVSTAVRNEAKERINLAEELRKSGPFFSQIIWLGQENRVKARLVATLLSDKEAEKRLRKIHAACKKRGTTPTQETLELALWSIYVTNVPEELLNGEQIHLVYSLRWQIELLFKLCKSEAGLAMITSKKSNRILCEIYAKLICVVMLFYICFPLRWHENREISFQKAYRDLKLEASNFLKALRSPYRFLQFIKNLFSGLVVFGMKDKSRKKRRLSYQRLMDSSGQEVLV